MRIVADSTTNEEPKRVTRTGLAVVHENELIYPAAGSQAQAMRATEDARNAVQMVFPVEVRVADAQTNEELEQESQDLIRRTAQRVRLST